MKMLLPVFVLLPVAVACGPSTTPPTPDAGPDTSCGLDCAAQAHYALQVGTCFEYSASNTAATPPDLAMVVKAVETLEGGMTVLPLEYRQSGQTRMSDFVTIKNGDLYLVRRTFGPGQSVTWKDEGGAPLGVTMLQAGSVVGESFTSTVKADVQPAGAGTLVATTFKGTAAAPASGDLKVPLKTYDQGLKLIYQETPDHGADTRRVFVTDVGFVLFATPLALSGGISAEYRLQKVRTVTAPSDCGL